MKRDTNLRTCIQGWLLGCASLAAIGLFGCQAGQQISQSAPAASAPLVFDLRPVARVFQCWNSVTQCYLSTSTIPNNQRQSSYQFSFLTSYHVLNSLTLDEDGSPITRTDSSSPPADKTFYFQGDVTNLNAGVGQSAISFFPKQFPGSKPHGQVSVIHITETSSNAQYRGTPQEKANSELQITYVDPGRCRIQDFHAEPTQTTKGNNITVQWQAVNCKKIELYRAFSPSSGAVVGGGGGFPARPEFEDMIPQMEGTLNGPRTFHTVAAGTETYKLIATNALGEQTQQTATATVTQPASPGSSPTPSQPACNAQSFPMCISCPNLPQADTSRLACSEQEARTQLEQENPGCTITTGGARQFSFCMQCPNGDNRNISFMGCTEEGARANGQRAYPSCQFSTGTCH